MLYLRARYYDPTLGNFISQDPLGLVNRYGYVNANPINLVDPSGLVFESLFKCGIPKTRQTRQVTKRTAEEYAVWVHDAYSLDNRVQAQASAQKSFWNMFFGITLP